MTPKSPPVVRYSHPTDQLSFAGHTHLLREQHLRTLWGLRPCPCIMLGCVQPAICELPEEAGRGNGSIRSATPPKEAGL